VLLLVTVFLIFVVIELPRVRMLFVFHLMLLHAQKALSRLNRSDRLLSNYRRPLQPVDASWAALRVVGDHDLVLPVTAA
jgi:hypothetical protein